MTLKSNIIKKFIYKYFLILHCAFLLPSLLITGRMSSFCCLIETQMNISIEQVFSELLISLAAIVFFANR